MDSVCADYSVTATCTTRFACQTIVLIETLAEQYTGAEAAIEASGHYRLIYEMLNEYLDVTRVNPSKNQIIGEVVVTIGRIDATRLALILWGDILAGSYCATG